MEETIDAWMAQNRQDAEKIGLRVTGIRKEFVKINIGSYVIQLIIPSAFNDPCPDNLNSDSVFMIIEELEDNAITSEKLEDNALIQALEVLNEKLERVRIGPDCVTKVFDNILQVFGSYKCRKNAMYKLAKRARVQCEEALRKSDEHPNLESILSWCSVSVDPSSETVVMEMKTKGILGSKNFAGAIGFCLDSPLVLLLRLGHLEEKQQFYVDFLGSVEFSVKQSLRKDDALVDEGLRNAISTYYKTKISQYGLQTLVPELVKEFFDGADRTGLVAESDNILVRLLIYIGTRLKKISNCCVCVFCRKELPSFSRWWACDADLCLYKFEETDTGASILQILQSSEWIEVELSLAADATTSERDVFEPYPPFLLKKQESRKRSGFFSEYPSAESIENLMASISIEPEIRAIGMKNYRANKKLELLHSIIESFPPVAEMQECTTDLVLMQKLGVSWLKHLRDSSNFEVDKFSEEDYAENARLPYNVLRYVLFTNKLFMYLLQEGFRWDVPGSLYQFAVFYNSERDQLFENRRETEGSIFAFHGSASCNWYSIIRNGLRCLSRTDYSSSGMENGQGIHLSTKMDDARSYSSPLSGWPNGNLKEYGVVAICEILSGQRYFVDESCLVVPPKNENDVAIRYLIVCKHEYDENGSLTTAGHLLSTKTNFLEAYQLLRTIFLSTMKV